MSDQHPLAAAEETQRLPAGRGVLATVWNAIAAAAGTVVGLLPHLLHHIGPLGGAVLVSGATGNLAFALLGLVLSLPLLRRLYRRFGTWKAPAVALATFAFMFSVSAFLIGPAIAKDGTRDRTPAQIPAPDEHASHHGG